MKLLLEHIRELVQVEDEPVPFRSGQEMAQVTTIRDAFLIIQDELIQDFGTMSQLKDVYQDDDFLIEIDCSNRLVYPTYCDSHTHLVFPASREQEFAGRIRGFSGGREQSGEGVRQAARLLHDMPDEKLYYSAMDRINEIMKTGTGAVEIKSGYGLNPADELRMLRIIKWIRETSSLCVRATFMGAHVLPEAYRHRKSAYVDLVINEMIPQVASEELADFIDVYCDRGYFSVEDTDRILMAGIKYGLRPKVHANKLGNTGGVEVGVKYNALSVDHLLHIGAHEIEILKDSETMPTVLPGVSFFMDTGLAPVREMIQAGLPVALASGYNPGTAPGGNMNLISSLACIQHKMLPEEVIHATTLNSAYAMGVSNRLGSIARGKIANVFITTEIPGIDYLPYSLGSNLVETVILNGEVQSF